MPKKFFSLSRSIKGRTKPISRIYFKGPSHFVDATGRTITPETHPQYINPNTGQLDIGRLRNAQLMGKTNEFPNEAGYSAAVTFGQAVWHLRNITYRKLKVQALTFEVEMAKAAVEIFKRSFAEKKFRSYGSKAWKPLAPYTVKQRLRHGSNPRNILKDTGTLMKSIKAVDGKGVVRTDPSVFGTARRHKGVCYAGIHNDPQFFGATNVAARNHYVTQRQFMGHSSYMRDEGWVLSEIHLFELLFTPIV